MCFLIQQPRREEKRPGAMAVFTAQEKNASESSLREHGMHHILSHSPGQHVSMAKPKAIEARCLLFSQVTQEGVWE